MKLFIPRRHLYTASTWAFSYQNKSYQGQVIVFFTHTSTFRLTAEDFKSERHDTDDSVPSTRWFIQLEKPSVTQICRPLLVQLVVQTVISPLACPFTMKSTHYNEHTVHNESDDTREWYIHLWPPGESRDCSPPPREEQRRHQDGERERESTHTHNRRSSVTNMQDFLLGNSDDGGGGRAEKLQALIRRADSDPRTEECDRWRKRLHVGGRVRHKICFPE